MANEREQRGGRSKQCKLFFRHFDFIQLQNFIPIPFDTFHRLEVKILLILFAHICNIITTYVHMGEGR